MRLREERKEDLVAVHDKRGEARGSALPPQGHTRYSHQTTESQSSTANILRLYESQKCLHYWTIAIFQ